jgi:hypothetical protein
LQKLIEAAEPVCCDDFGKASAMTLLKEKSGQRIGPLKVEFWRACQDY